jgi:DNA (cytosine-5)-methyltransferase 1
MELVLSLFTGAGLLDRGFREEGFCVVSAGDIILGHDVRHFTSMRHKFSGVIGGSPCQDFSLARRGLPPSGLGVIMLGEFVRIVTESQPDWFLLENVPNVPDISVEGYKVQRCNISASEVGCKQIRLRCFQFGSRDGVGLILDRGVTIPRDNVQPAALATEGQRKERRPFADFCELQGLPRTFALPGLSQNLKYRVVGNGVPVQLAQFIAQAIKRRHVTRWILPCACGCGRPVRKGHTLATAACRKRAERERKADNIPGPVTPELLTV